MIMKVPRRCFELLATNAPPPTHSNCSQPDRDVTRRRVCLCVCCLDELSPSSTGQHRRNLSEPAELSPFSKPDAALSQSVSLLSSDDW